MVKILWIDFPTIETNFYIFTHSTLGVLMEDHHLQIV